MQVHETIPTPQVMQQERKWNVSRIAEVLKRPYIFYLPVWGLGLAYVASGIAIRYSTGMEDSTGRLRIVWMLQYAYAVTLRAGPDLLRALAIIILLLAAIKVVSDRRGGVIGPVTLVSSEPPPLRNIIAKTIRVAGVVLFVSVLSMGLTQWKISIPYLRPFSFDEMLMRLDYAIHFQTHPWQLLHDVFGTSLVKLIDTLYHPTWMWLTWCIVPGMIAARGSANSLRQYLLAFTLVLIVLGTGLATVFASVGPIYYDAVVDTPGPYAPLISSLEAQHQTTPLTVWFLRDYLWNAYTTAQHSVASGISAMPSIHVATAALIAIVALKWNRKAAAAAVVYLLLILFGSVYLGWHYAVDGYLSIICTPLIWWGAGRFLSWYDKVGSNRARGRQPVELPPTSYLHDRITMPTG